ncbi:ATP-dependent dethiobiotin synthetase BioD [Bradyrhizobium sp. SSBR45G]|uniref:dethiobiotin synthase n=1 Tax=unclassified Bradyrhizobium TaxID=2631580 RepID=UPI002342BBB7|nr:MULTISPECIES: dethiobiotin synthase [unclassified Bradyrhizobium]GLH81026.1 ATP-dependent dethiobiotin synthetase BioD [Bradyrhizobium sp. SSBR45G]GLH89243.1 ATP-dependent dethiobiotin synthetase BioD [Bradyrhizobium sp. SSBR45R]
MAQCIVVTGTDTGIGKTVFAAGLTALLGACYWKPVQAGLAEETDSRRVQRLGDLGDDRVIPEAYRLAEPASPHLAARREGIRIDPQSLVPPEAGDRPVVIEGAGGVMVPLDVDTLYLDVFARWRFPVVLCARTSLGTINHSLLSLAALRSRGIDVRGIAFIGDAAPDSEDTICRVGAVKRLGRLPWLTPLTPQSLQQAFAAQFQRGDFER